MLDWLSKLFWRSREVPLKRRAPPPVRVACDDRTISVHHDQEGVATLEWSDLASVVVETDGAEPEPELLWILSDRDGRRTLTVPMDAGGERILLKAMQARLTGFDNMAVVEAMSSIGAGEFQVWPPSEML